MGNSNTKKPYARPTSDCELLPTWQAPEDGCCETGGYSVTDGAQGYCHNGVMYIATPLTEAKNSDDPFAGAQKNPPTWDVTTFSAALAQLSGPSDMDCFEQKFSDYEIDDTKIFEHFFTTITSTVQQGLPDEEGTPTQQLTPAVMVNGSLNPFQYTLNRNNPLLDWMPKCHNVLKLTLVSQSEINGVDGNTASLLTSNGAGYAIGGVTKKSGLAQSAEDSTTENDKPIEVDVWFDAAGNIQFDHEITKFPDPALLENGHLKFSVRMQGSAYSVHAPYTHPDCEC